MKWVKASAVRDGQTDTEPGDTCRTETKPAMPPARGETIPPCASPLLGDPSCVERQKYPRDFTPNETQKLWFSPPTHLLRLSWAWVIQGPVRCCLLSKCAGNKSSKIGRSEARMPSGLSTSRTTSYFSGSVRRFIFLRRCRCWGHPD